MRLAIFVFAVGNITAIYGMCRTSSTSVSFYLRRSCRFFVFSALSFEVFHLQLPLRLLTNYCKVDFLGKSRLPRENLTPSRKVDFLGKIGLPWEKLTSSGKVDFLGKSRLPRENLTPLQKLTPLGKVDFLGKI